MEAQPINVTFHIEIEGEKQAAFGTFNKNTNMLCLGEISAPQPMFSDLLKRFKNIDLILITDAKGRTI